MTAREYRKSNPPDSRRSAVNTVSLVRCASTKKLSLRWLVPRTLRLVAPTVRPSLSRSRIEATPICA